MSDSVPMNVAVVGAGLSGATLAQLLSAAGAQVQVFDKARGPGGRLATRRLSFAGADGRERTVRLDHGAPGFAITDPAFRDFLHHTLPAGALLPWTPHLAPGSRGTLTADPLWLPQGDMPSMCRALLQGAATTWAVTVERLGRQATGWQLWAEGQALPGHFDAVLLALPPAQAESLLAPHRPDWAQQAASVELVPCWTLMGVSASPRVDPPWQAAQPAQGPLAWAIRHDRRPGREPVAGEAHWVLHASESWSREKLERPADDVLPLLRDALHGLIGEPLSWQHAVVHRWRYALPPGRPDAADSWWDGALGLGVCGDFLGGPREHAAQGAWQSAQSLWAAMRS